MIVNSSRFNFADYVEEMLRGYAYDTHGYLDESIRETAREAVKKLKSSSPGKKYPKGWAVKYENGRFKVGATVYGKTGTYQLAHLLEYGHAKRNGGRTAPIVHIKPVEEWAMDEVHEKLLQKIGGFA